MPTCVDLTPEQESFLNTPQDLGTPTFDSPRAPVAQALHDASLTKKAIRHDDCGRFTRRDRCANGHVQTMVSYCGISICLRCAKEAAKERGLEFAPIALMMSELGTKLTFLELHLPCDADPNSVREVTNSAIRTYISLLPLGDEKLAAYDSKRLVDTILVPYNAGFNENGEMILRFLGVDDEHPAAGDHAAIKAAFPQATHKVVSTLQMSFFHKFLTYLFAVAIPKSPQAAAKMEKALTRVRRLRLIGKLYSSEINVEDTPAVTKNSDETDHAEDSDSDSGHKKCRICNSPIVSSERIYLNDALRSPHQT